MSTPCSRRRFTVLVAAIQTLVDLNDQSRIAQAIASWQQLETLAGEAQGVVGGYFAGVLAAEDALRVGPWSDGRVGGVGAGGWHAEVAAIALQVVG